MKTLQSLTGVCAAALLSASASFGASLSFDFSFTDSVGGVETVTGTVSGLMDNTNSAATSVVASGSVLGVSPLEFVLSASFGENEFTVLNGKIVKATFDDFIEIGVSRYRLILSTGLDRAEAAFEENPNEPGGAFAFVESSVAPEFTPSAVVSPIPLPAGGMLLLTGLAGVVGLSRRTSRAQRA